MEIENEQDIDMSAELAARLSEGDATPEVVETPEESAPPAEAPEAPPEAAETPPPEAAATADRPPASLSAMAKSKWNEWPDEVRKEISKREDDFHKGIAQYKEGHQVATALDQVVRPYMPMIQQMGVSPIANIQSLLQIQYEMQQNPQATLQKLAQSWGIEFGEQPQQLDPNASALQLRLQQLEQMVNSQRQSAEQQVMSSAQQDIAEFSADPTNLYFEDVKQDMAALLRSGYAKDLKDAYDKAVYANPTTRAALIASQRSQAEQQRIDEAKRKAANAKRAGFDVKGAGAVNAGSSKGMSIEDALQANGL